MKKKLGYIVVYAAACVALAGLAACGGSGSGVGSTDAGGAAETGTPILTEIKRVSSDNRASGHPFALDERGNLLNWPKGAYLYDDGGHLTGWRMPKSGDTGRNNGNATWEEVLAGNSAATEDGDYIVYEPIVNEFDEQGRLVSASIPSSDTLLPSVRVEYSYYPEGGLKEIRCTAPDLYDYGKWLWEDDKLGADMLKPTCFVDPGRYNISDDEECPGVRAYAFDEEGYLISDTEEYPGASVRRATSYDWEKTSSGAKLIMETVAGAGLGYDDMRAFAVTFDEEGNLAAMHENKEEEPGYHNTMYDYTYEYKLVADPSDWALELARLKWPDRLL